jgi:hypothetical protein
VTYIDEAFAKKCIQYPFVATTMNNKISKEKKVNEAITGLKKIQ